MAWKTRKLLLVVVVFSGLATLAALLLYPSVLDRAHTLWTLSFDSVVKPRGASIVFVGDMMFDRTILAMSEEEGGDFLFSCIADYLKGFDLAVGNLEGPITEYQSVSRGTVPGDAGNTRFTFPTSTASLLARSGIGAVSLANNHSLDFGRSGVASTRVFLSAAGVGFFGDPVDPMKKSLVIPVGGLNIAFVGFNQFLGVDSIARTVAEIERMDSEGETGAIVVFAHWGDEYAPVNEGQKEAARAFVDAGADLVVGAHPHVIQEPETYRETPIYYSLGNFMFDQYWEEGVRTGTALEALFKGDEVSVTPRIVKSSRTSGPCLVE